MSENSKKSMLALTGNQDRFTSSQALAVRSSLGAKDASDEDLAIFFHQATRTGLDPFLRQIYLIGRWDNRQRSNRYTIQIAIDGARIVAERSGVYAGQDEPEFEVDAQGNPILARVKVYRKDWERPSVGVARWDEFFPGEKSGHMWKKMPHVMLSKVAEMQALRKAFPDLLSGVYTAEEMAQADKPLDVVSTVSSASAQSDTKEAVEGPDAPVEPGSEDPISKTTLVALSIQWKRALEHTDEETLRGYLSREFQVSSKKELTQFQGVKARKALLKRNDAVEAEQNAAIPEAEIVEDGNVDNVVDFETGEIIEAPVVEDGETS